MIREGRGTNRRGQRRPSVLLKADSQIIFEFLSVVGVSCRFLAGQPANVWGTCFCRQHSRWLSPRLALALCNQWLNCCGRVFRFSAPKVRWTVQKKHAPRARFETLICHVSVSRRKSGPATGLSPSTHRDGRQRAARPTIRARSGASDAARSRSKNRDPIGQPRSHR
jgi:hypothetical protein